MAAPDPRAPAGVVPLLGRGDLAFEPIHGVPLYLHALHTLLGVAPDATVVATAADLGRVRAECRSLDATVLVVEEEDWRSMSHTVSGRAVLVHDPLCPLVPPSVLLDFVARGAACPGTSYVAYRPVTDTVKTAVDGRIEGTIDRELLAALASPVLVAAGVHDGTPLPLHDVERLLTHLRSRGPVELVLAPPIARRVDDLSAVHLLECVDELERRLRHEQSSSLSVGRPPGTP